MEIEKEFSAKRAGEITHELLAKKHREDETEKNGRHSDHTTSSPKVNVKLPTSGREVAGLLKNLSLMNTSLEVWYELAVKIFQSWW